MPRTLRQFWSYKIFRYWIVIAPFWIVAIGAEFLDAKGVPSMWRGCEELREFMMEDTGEPMPEYRIVECQANWVEWRNGKLFRATWPLLAFPLVLGVIWLQSRSRERTGA